MHGAVIHPDVFFLTLFLWTNWRVWAMTNLYETIRNNANTTRFADWIDDSEMKEVFISASCNGLNACPTVFVPNNLAVDAIASVLNWQSLTLVKKKYIVSGHIFEDTKQLTASEWTERGTAMNLRNVGFGTGRKMVFKMNNIRYTFQTEVGTLMQHFVNQARLIPPAIHATNGLVHIIDNVLNTPSSITPFLNYIMEQDNLKISAELWFTLQNNPRYLPLLLGQNEQYATFFVATDDAWSKVPQTQLQQLKTNTTLLVEVLSYGYLPNQLVYSQWTTMKPAIKLESGFPVEGPSSDSTKLPSAVLLRTPDGLNYFTVDGHATLLESHGEDIKQGIVYKTNSVLGYIWETSDQVLRRVSINFLQECQSDSACNSLLTTESYLTFFVPNDVGMARFRSLPSEQKATYLKYMVLRGRITREQMNDMRVITVDNLQQAIRFRIDGQDVFVEARLPQKGYVATQIVQMEQLATNGVIHLVDGIPGLPVQTVEQYLASKQEYSKFNAYRFVQENSLGGPYIYLIPTNAALQAMETDVNIGAVLLEDERRRSYIFRRHSLPITTLFEDLPPKQYKAPTENYAFTGEEIDLDIKVPHNKDRVTTIKFEDKSTDVTARNGAYQFVNGVVYRLNKLLYVEKDLRSHLCTNSACPQIRLQ